MGRLPKNSTVQINQASKGASNDLNEMNAKLIKDKEGNSDEDFFQNYLRYVKAMIPELQNGQVTQEMGE